MMNVWVILDYTKITHDDNVYTIVSVEKDFDKAQSKRDKINAEIGQDRLVCVQTVLGDSVRFPHFRENSEVTEFNDTIDDEFWGL